MQVKVPVVTVPLTPLVTQSPSPTKVTLKTTSQKFSVPIIALLLMAFVVIIIAMKQMNRVK